MDGRRSCSSSRAFSSGFDQLDEHILAQILDKLREASDRRSWRLVCRATYSLEVKSRKRMHLLRVELLEDVLQRYRNVQELDLSSCTGIKDSHLMAVAQLLKDRLASLDLHRVGGFSNPGLFNVTRHCSLLVQVDLSYCNSLCDMGLVALGQLSNLKKLLLTGCFRITDVGMGCLAANCKELEVLVLKGCIGITDTGLQLVAVNCLKLTSLDLAVTEVTDKGVELAACLKSLRSLNLMSCNVGDPSLAKLQSVCKSLVELDVSRCVNVSYVVNVASLLRSLNLSHTLVTEEGLVHLQKPNNIHCLKLDGCELTDQGLRYVAMGCKELKELSLSKCRGITDSGLVQVLSGCAGLRKLDLTCCCDLTESSLLSIAALCPALESLKMECSSMVTQRSLSLLWQRCKKLEEVDATDSKATDGALRLVGSCTSLKNLKLAYCNIRDDGISRLGCSVVYLDLYRCSNIGDAGIAAVAGACRNLRCLNISYCSKISDMTMSCISTLRKLQQLEIRGCILVTSDGLKQVAIGCQLLEELDLKRCTRIDDDGVLALEKFCPYLSQINVSYCPLTGVGMMSLARLGCMQNMKLVHLRNVSIECIGLALLQSACLRKVKLLAGIKSCLPAGVPEELEARGCRLRWVEKPL